jgi:copper homeostasis protein
MPEGPVLIEGCVDSVPSALAAEEGGAGRVELCDNLIEGGTTPSAGAIEEAKARLRIPVFVMIRPRGGDFLYTDVEYAVMRRDIAQAKRLGADGVVFGLLRADGTVDVERTRVLVDEARPLSVTFHRALDVARDAEEALDALMTIGVDRVLTSGQAPTAPEGAAAIAKLVRRAARRIVVLPGCGIDETNAARLVADTGVREVHLRGSALQPSAMIHRNRRILFRSPIPQDDLAIEVTEAERIRRLAAALGGA